MNPSDTDLPIAEVIRKKLVIIADDSSIFREMAAEAVHLLEPEGYDVKGQARDGQEALSQIIESTPDLLILDLDMPNVSGMQVLKRLPELNINIPVLVVSSFTQEKIKIAALAAGATHILSKRNITAQIIADAIRSIDDFSK